MRDAFEAFEELKHVVGFGIQDVANLQEIGPIFLARSDRVASDFYDLLLEHAAFADPLDGRLERLTRSFQRWFEELFSGSYGRRYCASRLAIGTAHARAGIPQHHVEAGVCLVRTRAFLILAEHDPTPAVLVPRYQSLLRLIDLDAILMNLAYDRERVDHISGQTREVIELLARNRAAK